MSDNNNTNNNNNNTNANNNNNNNNNNYKSKYNNNDNNYNNANNNNYVNNNSANNNNNNINYNINANINISNSIAQYANRNDFDIKDKLFLKVFENDTTDNFKKIWKLNMIRTKQFIEYTLNTTPNANNTPNENNTSNENNTVNPDNIAKKYLKYLSKMNSLGFITIDSQSDLQEIAVYPETKEYSKKDPKNETSPYIVKYIQYQQPYIEGFIPLKIYSQFVEKLDNISKFCYSIDLVKDDYDVNVTNEYIRYSDNTSVCTPHTSFTKRYLGKDERDFKIKLLGTINENSYGGGVKGLKINKDEWVFVVVVDTRVPYNVEAPDGLFTSVIKALEESLEENTKNKNMQNRNRNLNKTAKNRNNRNSK